MAAYRRAMWMGVTTLLLLLGAAQAAVGLRRRRWLEAAAAAALLGLYLLIGSGVARHGDPLFFTGSAMAPAGLVLESVAPRRGRRTPAGPAAGEPA
ncbi:hypothetical protein [Kitasatospora sp. KL5]|uniref:hypothetical protein n=1 Tax=Kitasatospora sp. KL5 TaxID=3425125 RepID=UPI003D6EC9B3